MPPTRVADLLDLARARSFVGRRSELAAFGRLLETGGVLYLYGPGGIGKSTTLLEFHREARRCGRTIDALEGSEIDPSPEAFRSALGPASVLLIDGYENLA